MTTIRPIMLRELKEGSDIDFDTNQVAFQLWRKYMDNGIRYEIGNSIYINICSKIKSAIEGDQGYQRDRDGKGFVSV